MSEVMHIILKYNDTAYNRDTVKEHTGVLNNSGKVIWGVIKPTKDSPKISKNKIDNIKNQIKNSKNTYAYLATKGKVTGKAKIEDILEAEEVLENKHLVPEYYQRDLERCVAGMLLSSIEEESEDIIHEIQRYGSDGGNVALGNQTNPLYVSFKEENKDMSLEKDIYEKLIDHSEDVRSFISEADSYISSNGFICTYKDLCNVYLSLKVKPFIILAGISGTGKSRMIRLFSEAAGANSNNGRFRMISVKPDWNDSTELLGYKNLSDSFVPGILTDIIDEAMDNKDVPYFICLDEMNLARAEYYLSDYLSLIETRRRNGTSVITDKLFDKSTADKGYEELYIPENIYIIGTVNMDDTTFSFSRKVLDRANTIEFSNVNLEKLFLEDEYRDEPESTIFSNQIFKSSYLGIQEIEEEYREYAKKVNESIISINKILSRGKRQFAYRVREDILFYMVENKKNNLIDEDGAFDFQIMQKILPTISGSQVVVKEVLIDLFNFCIGRDTVYYEDDYVEESMKVLHEARYPLSAEKIIYMLKGYRYDGISTFWF